MARLGDIATTITKGTTPTSVGFDFTDTGINFIKIESISATGNFIPDKFAHVSSLCNEKLKRSQLKENDILFSIAGAIGRVAIVDKDILPANTNQALAIIRIPEGIIDYSFLFHALQSPALQAQFEKQKQGVAQINLSLKDIENFIIPDYSLDKQYQIATLFNQVSNLISLRKQQLANLDKLVEARFIEMFGDTQINPYDFDKSAMAAIALELFAGGDKPSDISDLQDEQHPYPVYANGEINNGLQGYAENYRVSKDALTVSARGTIGFCCIRKGRFTPVVRLITIVPKGQINIVYLACAVGLIKFKNSGSSQAQLTIPDFKNIPILVPPIELQEKFASFVQQTDKLKFEVRETLEKLETLKKALMQKYFSRGN